MARLALLAALTIILVGCGSGEGARPKRDAAGKGDPYVTRAQVRRIRVGMSANAAFRLLRGRADSGQHTAQPFEFDYPIWGTGTGDAAGVGEFVNSSYSWLIICVKDGRVVDTNRHQSLAEGCNAEERSDKEAAQARRVGPVVTIARGAGWVLRGWRSTYGICVTYRPRPPGAGWPVCGFGRREAYATEAGSSGTTGAYVCSLGRKTLIIAAVGRRVSSVKVKPHRTALGAPVRLYRPPRALRTRWRFLRLVLPTGSPTGRPPRWRVLALNSSGNYVGGVALDGSGKPILGGVG